jgi:hypothetical protein
MPDPSTACRRATSETALWQAACGRLLPLWTHRTAPHRTAPYVYASVNGKKVDQNRFLVIKRKETKRRRKRFQKRTKEKKEKKERKKMEKKKKKEQKSPNEKKD